ncbi:MAG: SusC/RagA family TonB-linked outer membrane protein [Flammeovirgaceae bacterium]
MFRFILVSFLFLASNVWAQDRTISGSVSSDEDGSGLPGVNVILQGTTIGTTTDVNGSYSLDVPSDGGTLVFSFIGLVSQEVAIGARSVVDVVMSSDVEELQEVVVTALGITKEKAALGYAVTSVGGEQLEARPEADIARLLRGKVPGVDITSQSGVSGTGTNIIIRGYTSISGSNQPLFVLDGVPIDGSTYSDRGFTSGGATASSRFLDLDPNNVAEISVLKGLAATVLYGEAGRNGVILITTKTGQIGSTSNKGLEVSYSQSYFVNQVASVPDDQDQYGNGWQNRASAAFSNWGAPFDDPNRNGLTDGTIKHPYDRSSWNAVFPQYVGARWKYQAYDNLQNFFVDGSQQNTSIGINAQVGSSSIKANYGWTKDNGYIPFNDYRKHNFALGANTQLANGLKINASFNYIESQANKPPVAPSRNSNASNVSLFGNVLYTPRSWNLFGLEYERPDTRGSVYYRGDNGMQHPLWTLHNSRDKDDVNRFIGNVTLSYEVADFLNLTYRIGLDRTNMLNNYMINKNGVMGYAVLGAYQTSYRNNINYDQVVNLNGSVELSEDLDFDFLVGANLQSRNYELAQIFSSDMFIFDFFDHSNFTVTTANSYVLRENTYGAYANLSLGYKDWGFLTASARNDWTSTLEPENRSFLYPSVSLSVLPFDALGISNQNLNFLKVRFGFGTSAGYPSPYSTRGSLVTRTKVFQTSGGTLLNSNNVSTFFANPGLTPEIHKEIELGIEGKFFQNRVGIDLSLFTKDSEDLIIDLDLDATTGYRSSTVNSASINNKGLEAIVSLVPVQSRDFTWEVSGQFSLLRSEVLSIADGVEKIYVAGYVGRGNIAIPGLPFGIMEGDIIKRDYGSLDGTDHKQVHWDDRTNYTPIVNSNGGYQQLGYAVIGDPNPDFVYGVTNTLTYKWLTARVQFDASVGGDVFSTTSSTLLGRGILEETGFDRFVPVVTTGLTNDGAVNTKQTTANAHYWPNTGVFYDENSVYDASVMRLREVSLSLVAPKSFLNGTPFGSASLTVSAQNLWHLAYNFPRGANFDPEVISYGTGSNARGWDEMTGPTAKKYGATLSLTF